MKNAEDDFLPGLTSSSTLTYASSGALSYKSIKEAIELLKELPPEPLGEFMRERGCPPEEWILFLPTSLRQEVLIPPEYVRFSALINTPICIKRMEGL